MNGFPEQPIELGTLDGTAAESSHPQRSGAGFWDRLLVFQSGINVESTPDSAIPVKHST